MVELSEAMDDVDGQEELQMQLDALSNTSTGRLFVFLENNMEQWVR